MKTEREIMKESSKKKIKNERKNKQPTRDN
jgi:hypothetical protein